MKNSHSIKFVVSTSAYLVLMLLVAGAAQAFVGSIAVALGQLNEVGEIKTSFSADAKLETEEMTVDTRIFYKPGKVRDEIKVVGHDMVTIHRFDLAKIWVILGRGMYMEIAPGKANKQNPDFKLISREIMGPETVNGMPTTKYKSVYESRDGRFDGFTWYTEDNIAVKGFLVHESKGEKQRVKYEFTNLVRAEQPDSLFDIPAGYQKIDLGGLPGLSGVGGLPIPGVN